MLDDPTPEQLDAAYFLCKNGGAASMDACKAEMARRWPDMHPLEIDAACQRALELIGLARVLAEELRGPKNDHAGSTNLDLRAECPGFSEATYIDVEGWAMDLTR